MDEDDFPLPAAEDDLDFRMHPAVAGMSVVDQDGDGSGDGSGDGDGYGDGYGSGSGSGDGDGDGSGEDPSGPT